MNPWMQAVLVLSAASAGLGLGWFYFARTYRRAVWGAVAAVGWLAIVLTAHFAHLFSTFGGLDWIAASRNKFLFIGFALCFGMVGPLPHLNRRWKQAFTLAVLAIFAVLFIGIPFVGPAVFEEQISRLPTHLDQNGICRQSTSFTCGPAAAVSVLHRLGLEASEGEIARASGTAPALGTGIWDLYQGLRRLYPPEQLQCRYLRAGSLAHLPDGEFILAVIRETFWLDHCVAILEIRPTSVIFADPVNGLSILPRSAFEACWRKSAIVLRRPDLHTAGL